jgi:hypothetical protein
MKNKMKNIISKFSLVLVGFISGVVLLISFDRIDTGSGIDVIHNADAGTFPQAQVMDQMVCHAGKILTVLNKNYSKKSLTCMKRSTRTTHDYNNLADIYAEGWFVVDINNVNTWVFNK